MNDAYVEWLYTFKLYVQRWDVIQELSIILLN